jgi:hypothetical protein
MYVMEVHSVHLARKIRLLSVLETSPLRSEMFRLETLTLSGPSTRNLDVKSCVCEPLIDVACRKAPGIWVRN